LVTGSVKPESVAEPAQPAIKRAARPRMKGDLFIKFPFPNKEIPVSVIGRLGKFSSRFLGIPQRIRLR
jgi:hypothetical protein